MEMGEKSQTQTTISLNLKNHNTAWTLCSIKTLFLNKRSEKKKKSICSKSDHSNPLCPVFLSTSVYRTCWTLCLKLTGGRGWPFKGAVPNYRLNPVTSYSGEQFFIMCFNFMRNLVWGTACKTLGYSAVLRKVFWWKPGVQGVFRVFSPQLSNFEMASKCLVPNQQSSSKYSRDQGSTAHPLLRTRTKVITLHNFPQDVEDTTEKQIWGHCRPTLQLPYPPFFQGAESFRVSEEYSADASLPKQRLKGLLTCKPEQLGDKDTLKRFPDSWLGWTDKSSDFFQISYYPALTPKHSVT